MTRCVVTSSGMTRSQCVALPAGPCRRTTSGPEPPSRTAVETPASADVPLRDGKAGE